jgi:hypothetical protein
MAFAGWTEFKAPEFKPLPGPHLVCGFLATAPNGIVDQIHIKPMRAA